MATRSSPFVNFSSRSSQQIFKPSEAKKEAVYSFSNFSYLNHQTASVENLLKTKSMEKYKEVFRSKEIDILPLFCAMTELDLVEIGINNKLDRMIILDMVAECKGEIYSW